MNDHPKTEVELLVSEHQRRCLCTDETGRDEIDMDLADPIRDHAPQVRSHGKVNRVLSILDKLEKESNRRCSR